MAARKSVRALIQNLLHPFALGAAIADKLDEHDTALSTIETQNSTPFGVIYAAISFGVIDGNADDTKADANRIAIQAAIDACNAAGGGNVLLPAGHIRISRAGSNIWGLKVPVNVRLVGQGRNTTFLELATSDANATGNTTYIVYLNGDHASLQDLTIYGNKPNPTTVAYDVTREHHPCVFVENGAENSLVNVTVYRCSGDGVQIYNNVTSITMDRVYSYENNRQGISLTPTSSATPVIDVRIDKCKSYNNGLQQLDCEAGGTGFVADLKISASLFDVGTSTQYAMVIFVTQKAAINGCTIKGTVEMLGCTDIAINGGTIDDTVNGGGAIFCYQQNSRISLNGVCLKSTHAVANSPCVRVEAAAGKLTSGFAMAGCVVDCSSAPASSVGIMVKTATDVTITGCTLVGPGLAAGAGVGQGMLLRATLISDPFRSATVVGCTIRNFGRIGIDFVGNSTAQILYAKVADVTFDDTAGTMTKAISLDDGTHALQSVDVKDCKMMGGCTTMIANALSGTSQLVAATASNSGWLSK